MSELKVIKIELNNYGKPIASIQGTTSYYGISPNDKFYPQEEADTVFRRLKARLAHKGISNQRLEADKNDNWHKYCTAMAELRHQKYKRCMDKAQWCEATALWCYQAANTLPAGFQATLHGNPVMIEPDRLYKRYIRLTKWENRWLELAKKFK